MTLLEKVITLLVAGSAVCPAQITFVEYNGPATPAFESAYALVDITSGPDGNLWFTEGYAFGGQTSIGRITISGVTSYFQIPSGSSEQGIVAGPDGNVWFTGYRTGKIGRIAPDGGITEFAAGGHCGIALGPDGNLWFTGCFLNSLIGRITPSGTVTWFQVPNFQAAGFICSGPDGNLWFTEPYADRIGRITTTGVITEFPLSNGSYPYRIVSGPDGNLWFTENQSRRIGRITPSGTITEFPLPLDGPPLAITVGPDNNLWYTEDSGGHIGRITTAGVITRFAAPSPGRLGGITKGPDGNLWFLESTANKIVKASLSTSLNRPPIAVDDIAQYPVDVAQGSSISVRVLSNDSDPDGDRLTIDSVGQAQWGKVLNESPLAVYTPGPQFAGRDAFTYTVSDGRGGTATATVSITRKVNSNRVPAARADAASTSKNTAVRIAVLANDSDPDLDPLSVSIQQNPAHGSASVSSDQQINYVPALNFEGEDQLKYQINDGRGGTATAFVNIAVGPQCAVDVTNAVTVYQGPLSYTIGGYIGQLVIITNGKGPAIQGPLSFVIDPLPGSQGKQPRLASRTGQTSCAGQAGSDYIDVKIGSDGQLTLGESAKVVGFALIDPRYDSSKTENYVHRVLAGPGGR